uniref:Uncharacterized protein n=1 Tax=Arundo donax TaxID=35708 RepID=A0A0A9EED6_ARUDO
MRHARSTTAPSARSRSAGSTAWPTGGRTPGTSSGGGSRGGARCRGSPRVPRWSGCAGSGSSSWGTP